MAPAKISRLQNGSGVPILNRALRVLDHLRQSPLGQSLTEIARALGFPKNTVHRILNTLAAHDYVRRDNARLYTLSRKMASLAYDSAQDRGLLENSLDVMRRLRDATQETTVISILDRNEGLVLEQVQSSHPFRFVCDPGTRQTLHTSASTKAILAFLPEAEREAALERITFRRLTANTLTSRPQFDKVLGSVRQTGYAVDGGEALDGVHCVAAPIFNHQGFPVAALTITGPAERVPASAFAGIGKLVKAHAAEISKRLGYGLNGNQESNPGGRKV